jgi:hypothetical protein
MAERTNTMNRILYILLITVVTTSCKYSRSAGKDLISGITTAGKDLSCEDVYITVDNEKTSKNTFIYGETFVIYFNDIEGFAVENGNVFPCMEIIIKEQEGDTLMKADDLYENNTEGFNYKPLKLSADLTVAAPLRSKGNYTMIININDKKGDGSFTTRYDFDIIENGNIKIETTNTTYNEVYLFSQGKNKVITENKIDFDDNIYIIIEGLKGFKEENGYVFPGLKLQGTDSLNNLILDYDDLFTEYDETGIELSDFISRVSAHFKITGTFFNNPLHCELRIWDKKSDAEIEVTTDMSLK